MRYSFQFKINVKGGILSPGNLLHITEALQDAGLEHVRIGLRQQLLIDVTQKNYDKLITSLDKHQVNYEVNKDEYPNIVSSYAAEDIFVNDGWLREGVYKDIFDLFDYQPKLKLNFSDNNQTFTPFFSGNINWIASASNQFWYLFIRFPKTDVLYQWPQLVYTNDLPRLSQQIEATIFEEKDLFYANHQADGQLLYNSITAKLSIISKTIDEPLSLPAFNLPYYEGFNSYGNKTWLGIYRRDELFAVDFLKDIATTCMQTKVGQLYTTPWKSIIIKNIERKDRQLWDFILGKYRINVRHAANELNWQVEDNNDDGLNIKRHIIREFDKQDVRTFGLCFAVKTLPESGMFGSVIIQRQFAMVRKQLKALDKYDILYAANFNPNSKDYTVFRKDVSKEHLDTYLISLCKHYYELQNKEQTVVAATYQSQQKEEENIAERQVYQCSHCLTVYDETLGEEENNIAAGTAFAALPATYTCPLCEALKEDFVAVNHSDLSLLVS